MDEQKFLAKALEIWDKAYFNGGKDRALNITRFHDLLSRESGAYDWPDEMFLGEEIGD